MMGFRVMNKSGIYPVVWGICALLIGGCATPLPPAAAPAPSVAAPVAEPGAPAASLPAPTTETQVIAAVNNENSVFFARGSLVIDARDKAKLQQHAERLKADRKLRVRLVGYADDLGSPSYNLAISENRVAEVYGLLRKFGVLSEQLRRASMGSEKTDKACRSSACRSRMRRVELQYTD